MSQGNEDNLIWIDLEMTGLDPASDSILEIATVVTDRELNVLAEGPEFAIRHPLERLQAMDEWNRSQHGKSGLWQRVLESAMDLATAEGHRCERLGFLLGRARARNEMWNFGGARVDADEAARLRRVAGGERSGKQLRARRGRRRRRDVDAPTARNRAGVAREDVPYVEAPRTVRIRPTERAERVRKR